jgi:hypothetical protein
VSLDPLSFQLPRAEHLANARGREAQDARGLVYVAVIRPLRHALYVPRIAASQARRTSGVSHMLCAPRRPPQASDIQASCDGGRGYESRIASFRRRACQTPTVGYNC